MNEMHDFVLRVMSGDTGYLIYAECPSAGESGPQPIDKTALTSFGEYSHSTAKLVGRNLYQAIIQDEIYELFERALAVAESESAGLRIVLKLGRSPELLQVPWELLHNGQEFLTINPKTPVVRYLEQTPQVNPIEVQPPIRVLFTTAYPEGEAPLDLATEERHMRKALEQLGEKVDLVVERNISVERLRLALMRAQNRDSPFHIWHHCGHSGIVNGKFMLVLEQNRKRVLADVSQVNTLVKAYPTLRVVTLNVCHGTSAVGLAPALATLNVPAVIGFRGSILDQSALIFAEVFYEAIFYAPVDVALGQARMALAVQNSQALNWALPLLCLRMTSPFILKKTAVKSKISLGHLEQSSPSNSGLCIKFGGKVRAERVNMTGIENPPEKPPNAKIEFNQEIDADDVKQVAVSYPNTQLPGAMPGEALQAEQVIGIPPNLYKQLQTTLLRCGPFGNDNELKAAFIDTRISLWRDRLPEATDPTSRVQAIIEFLATRRHNQTRKNGLVLLLQALGDKIAEGDICHQELARLANELEHTL